MHPISFETTRYQRLKEQLIVEHSDIDEETLADTLEGLTDLNEIIAATIRSALEDEVVYGALKTRLDDIRARRDRIKQRAQTKRALCAMALSEAGLSKVLAPDLTISLRPSPPQLIIEDESRIPPIYWRTPAPELSRRELTSALKSGDHVPGAHLGEPGLSLTVRVK